MQQQPPKLDQGKVVKEKGKEEALEAHDFLQLTPPYGVTGQSPALLVTSPAHVRQNVS